MKNLESFNNYLRSGDGFLLPQHIDEKKMCKYLSGESLGVKYEKQLPRIWFRGLVAQLSTEELERQFKNIERNYHRTNGANISAEILQATLLVGAAMIITQCRDFDNELNTLMSKLGTGIAKNADTYLFSGFILKLTKDQIKEKLDEISSALDILNSNMLINTKLKKSLFEQIQQLSLAEKLVFSATKIENRAKVEASLQLLRRNLYLRCKHFDVATPSMYQYANSSTPSTQSYHLADIGILVQRILSFPSILLNLQEYQELNILKKMYPIKKESIPIISTDDFVDKVGLLGDTFGVALSYLGCYLRDDVNLLKRATNTGILHLDIQFKTAKEYYMLKNSFQTKALEERIRGACKTLLDDSNSLEDIVKLAKLVLSKLPQERRKLTPNFIEAYNSALLQGIVDPRVYEVQCSVIQEDQKVKLTEHFITRFNQRVSAKKVKDIERCMLQSLWVNLEDIPESITQLNILIDNKSYRVVVQDATLITIYSS